MIIIQNFYTILIYIIIYGNTKKANKCFSSTLLIKLLNYFKNKFLNLKI